jgi:hypothetical protein
MVNVTEAERARAPGHFMGMTVLVDPQTEDYYYPLLSTYGVKVKTLQTLTRSVVAHGPQHVLNRR